jgi:hypothetical protein
MNIALLSFVGIVAVSPLQAQSPAPLPETLAGQYLWENTRKESRMEVISVKLSEITTEGESVKGVVSDYRSPAGYCVSDNTPFKGSYKDGALNISSAPMKNTEGKTCPGIAIDVKVDGRRATGTLKLGSQGTQRVELEMK